MPVRNVLFVMCDQLRFDHLSCYGHPHLHTPNLDALAARGVRFTHAFVQSGVCGPSRMSFYTGRYVGSHGATWNRVPLSVGEWTLGDHLRAAGLPPPALAGKTHVMIDVEGLDRFGIPTESEPGTLLAHGGFREIDRYDGHSPPGPESGYPAFLRDRGYHGADPWTDHVISGTDDQGRVVSGWQMRNARYPARVREEHSETAYMTDVAIRFVEQSGDRPWVLHLSYVKPHWPYMAPAPYHAMYTATECLPVARRPEELFDAHPVLAAYRRQDECVSFARDEVIATVRPVYRGLVRQIDDHLGRLWATLDRLGRWKDTLVVFTSDHGDLLGDHWLGEKEHFYDVVQRVPLIVHDPDPSADASRGSHDERLVEAIDVLPTILDALGLPTAPHRLEGRSLLPAIRGRSGGTGVSSPDPPREAVFSELDYSFREARRLLGRSPGHCRAAMVRTREWKYVHWEDLPPMLFDLVDDPGEFRDLGREAGYQSVRASLREVLMEWQFRRKRRTTVTDEEVEARTNAHRRHGIHFGIW